MFCRFCATSNPEGATHCRACSAPLAAAPPAPAASVASPWAAPASQAPTAPPKPSSPYSFTDAPASLPMERLKAPAVYGVPPAAPQVPAAQSQDRTLAQVLASRGGSLSDAESLRYVEAVARALAHELGQGRAPRHLDPERIVVQPDGSMALHLEWQEMNHSPRQIESHLAHELERLSQLLRGQSSAHGIAGAAPRAGSEAAARARVERVSFFDTARDMMRGALMPFSVPPSAPPTGARTDAGHSARPSSAPDAFARTNATVAPPASTLSTGSAASANTAAPSVPRKEVVAPPAVKLDFDKTKAQIVRSWSRGKVFSKIGWGREGRELWSIDEEGVLAVWNVETGTCAARMEARFRGAAVCSVAFMGREEMVATGHDDGRLCLWMPRANRLRASLEAHAGRTSAVCFASSPAGRPTVFSGGGDGNLRAWDALDGKGVGTEVEVTLLNVRESSVSSDGQRVALGGDGGRIEVWRYAAARLEWSSALHEFWITALAFSPDGRVLASGGYDRAVRLWSGASGALGREFKVHESFVSALRWTPGGDFLFSLSCDGALWMHDWKGSRSRQVASEDGLQDFILHPDGRHFACASRDGLSLWRLD